MSIGTLLRRVACGDLILDVSSSSVSAWGTIRAAFSISLVMRIRWFINPLSLPSVVYIQLDDATIMVGKKDVDKATKGLNALIDEFTSSVKELVNAGEETVIHLAVGGGRVISAIVNAGGEVTKVSVETAGNVLGTVGSGIAKAVKLNSDDQEEKESENK